MINKHFEVELPLKLHWIQIISNSAVQRINSCNALHFGFHNISKLVCFSARFQIDSGSVRTWNMERLSIPLVELSMENGKKTTGVT
jgi:hypothetical protein